MKTYEISGIKIGIDYKFDFFLKNNIEKYEKDVKPDHFIRVDILDEIPTPSFLPQIKKGSKCFYQSEEKEYIYSLNQIGQITDWVEHDHNYKSTQIKLKNGSMKQLAELEYILIGVVFLEIALKYSLLPIHASAIGYQNLAILFSAPSKTGKSTIANRWIQRYPNSVLINDDKPLLSIKDGQVFASSSPFSGKTSENQNLVVPLKTIIFLKQARINQVIELSTAKKIQHIMKNIIRPKEEATWDRIITMMNHLVLNIPMYEFHATNDEQALDFIKQILDS